MDPLEGIPRSLQAPTLGEQHLWTNITALMQAFFLIWKRKEKQVNVFAPRTSFNLLRFFITTLNHLHITGKSFIEKDADIDLIVIVYRQNNVKKAMAIEP